MRFVFQGYIWAEDKEHCEEYGRMLQADPSKVSIKAKKRGLPQVHGLISNKLNGGGCMLIDIKLAICSSTMIKVVNLVCVV